MDQQPVTQNFFAVTNSTLVVPCGARGWGYIVTQGSVTINGISYPAGSADSSDWTLANVYGMTFVASAGSIVNVRYGT